MSAATILLLEKYGIALILGYILGAIPFGWIWVRLFLKKNICQEGSGNVGAANALRAGGKLPGILTLVGDVGKAYLSITLIPIFFLFFFKGQWHWELMNPFYGGLRPFESYFAAMGVIIGHCFSFWLRFKGGKGVAVSFGIVLVLSPLLMGVGLVIWYLVFKRIRISSVSSMVAFSPLPLVALFLLEDRPLAGLMTFLFFFIVQRHKENILRLLEGTENSFKK